MMVIKPDKTFKFSLNPQKLLNPFCWSFNVSCPLVFWEMTKHLHMLLLTLYFVTKNSICAFCMWCYFLSSPPFLCPSLFKISTEVRGSVIVCVCECPTVSVRFDFSCLISLWHDLCPQHRYYWWRELALRHKISIALESQTTEKRMCGLFLLIL